ncbi:DUF3027 domain-containing protein [Microbacterium arborescens]
MTSTPESPDASTSHEPASAEPVAEETAVSEDAPTADDAATNEPAAVDERLLAAHELALAALAEITPAATVGDPVDYVIEADGVVSLRFANRLAGYPGWLWTVSVAVVEDAEPTVLEVELLPAAGALLAPEWVPWAVRLAEYQAAQAAADEDESDDDLDDDDAVDLDDADDIDDDDDADDDDFADGSTAVTHAGDVDGVDIDALDAGATDDDDSDEDSEDDSDEDDESDEDDDESDHDESPWER